MKRTFYTVLRATGYDGDEYRLDVTPNPEVGDLILSVTSSRSLISEAKITAAAKKVNKALENCP